MSLISPSLYLSLLVFVVILLLNYSHHLCLGSPEPHKHGSWKRFYVSMFLFKIFTWICLFVMIFLSFPPYKSCFDFYATFVVKHFMTFLYEKAAIHELIHLFRKNKTRLQWYLHLLKCKCNTLLPTKNNTYLVQTCLKRGLKKLNLINHTPFLSCRAFPFSLLNQKEFLSQM